MKQDRFLLVLLGVILALIVLALALFFTRQQSLDYVADDSPQGVVHNYVIALLKKDYEKAYSYLYEDPKKPSLETFKTAFVSRQLDPSAVSVEIGDMQQGERQVTVNLLILHSGTDPFSSGYNEQASATLVLTKKGEWKLSSMPYPFWSWDWYNPPVEPVPAPGSD
jgi:hypothetical protein